jgi:hypothetical protein
MKLTARTYLDKTRTRAVAEGTPEAAWLLGLAGEDIPDDQAEALGLKEAPTMIEPTPEPESEPIPEPEPAPEPVVAHPKGRKG